MKKVFNEELNSYRIKVGRLATPSNYGFTGAFIVPSMTPNQLLFIVSSGKVKELGVEGELGEWEHVSVSLPKRCPNWKEMKKIKEMFWDNDEVVVQFHPEEKEYVNLYPHCLHMWKYVGGKMPTPPREAVGPITKES